tara:strand:+ start:4232 stop:4990 length:759 start_codon:yes stop_codon:yes gene_type:complete
MAITITKPSNWAIKDRTYLVKGNGNPVIFTIPCRHTQRKPLMWFDEEKGINRELRYATNQNSPFVDEQRGLCTLGHVVMKEGKLVVPKSDQALQLLLSVYHPKKGILYEEFEPEAIADNQVDWIEFELKALTVATQLEIDEQEAILRVEKGSVVSKMSSKEIKRDVLLMARNNPKVFLELAADDNVQLRNIGVKAVEANIIKLSSDQRTFTWGNGRKLFTVPFDEHPYSALAAWFKTDEGLEVFKSVQKRLQ